MNLVGDPWIPVVSENGKLKLVSLAEFYQQADRIRDLVATPPQRVSLMRLFICITQAALDGPENEEQWFHCRDRIVSESLRYLESRKEQFELFGKSPFLQAVGLERSGNATLDKLDFGLAAGNNAALFDHGASPEGRYQSPAWCSLMLLTYQCFSPGGLIGQANWNGTKTKKTSEHAPCIEGSALHTIIKGETLDETLHLNLLSKASVTNLPNTTWGVPVWDTLTKGPEDPAGVENARSYLGRLVPMSRAILLVEGSRKFTLANGISYPKLPELREPSATVILNRKQQYSYLRTDPSKHPWRELSAILSLAQEGFEGGALTLQHTKFYDQSKISSFELWTGGMAADKGKILDVAEWNITIPTVMLGTLALTKYQGGVQLADEGSKKLNYSIRTYCKEMKMGNHLAFKGRTYYWELLDTAYQILLQASQNQEEPLSGAWYRTVYQAMRKAYRHSCPFQTPRQLQAFAKGLRSLSLKKP